ncbi:MAG: spore germination protein [Clostridia bacterium]|jgi:spore germination protein KA|nr:spore germination protein [Clostridia bacterium]
MKIFDKFINLITYQEPNNYNFILPDAKNVSYEKSANGNEEKEPKKEPENVFPSIDVNKEFIKEKFSFKINNDIKIREFYIHIRGKEYASFLLYIDGMIDSKSINEFVIKPLMIKNRSNTSENTESIINTAIANNVTVKRVKKFDLKKHILEFLVPQNDVSLETKFKNIIQKVNAGNSALFIDTIDSAFMIDAKGFDKRSVSPPENESIIRGSQEGFIESIRTNTSLLRRIVNSENFIIEETTVGKISNTQVAICYLKNIANEGLVKEVKHRIKNVSIDYLVSSGQLEQLIEDSSISVPQLISSERPDRVSAYILEGRIAILVNGTPYGLVAPAVLIDFLTSAEDKNLKYQLANLLKAIRLLALFITLLLPGLYVAISAFHQELIPTELLFAIVASRSNVPFPVIFEILIMEISLELIRESGVRVPAPLGQAIGIVRSTYLR